MNLSLPPRLQKLIDDRVRSGAYASAEDVLAAALTHLEAHEQARTFGPGEIDALVAEGEADIARGEVLELDVVFAELRRMSTAKRAATQDTLHLARHPRCPGRREDIPQARASLTQTAGLAATDGAMVTSRPPA